MRIINVQTGTHSGVESEERVSVSNLESDVWVEAGSGFGMNRK